MQPTNLKVPSCKVIPLEHMQTIEVVGGFGSSRLGRYDESTKNPKLMEFIKFH